MPDPSQTQPTRSESPTPHESLPGFRRGIENLETVKREAQRQERKSERLAEFITRISGTMAFVWIHVGWFGLWTIWNTGRLAGLKPFDPYPFGLLTMIVSLEAIFLSTFVLISQNQEQRVNAIRDEVQTQISLYQEQELTQVLRMVHRIEKHLGLEDDDEATISAMEHFVDADDLFRHIESAVTRSR
jgi:uncharacterized membrane protein